jgi:carbon-monoxide dehydrogenase medium subunit
MKGYGKAGRSMKEVEYFTPETLDEAAALLLAAGSHARWLPGGADLAAEVVEGGRTISIVLDLKRIPELNRLDYDERSGLRIGAAAPFKTILEFSPVRRLYSMLADGSVSGAPGQSSDSVTLGGSLADAISCAEMSPPLICLRASAGIFGPYGWSEQALEALLAGTGRIILQPGEFVVDLHFPAPPPRSGGAYLRAVAPGGSGCDPTGVGVFLVLEQDLLTCCGARLALCGVSPAPMRALEAERFLSGKVVEGAVLQEAVDLTIRSVGASVSSSGGHPDVLRSLARRAIEIALERVHATTHV